MKNAQISSGRLACKLILAVFLASCFAFAQSGDPGLDRILPYAPVFYDLPWYGWIIIAVCALGLPVLALWLRDSKRKRSEKAGNGGTDVLKTVILILAACSSANAQSDPWSTVATRLQQAFTGPIARGFALVAIVIGGLELAFDHGSGRRMIGGLIFGLGMALLATQFMTWLFS